MVSWRMGCAACFWMIVVGCGGKTESADEGAGASSLDTAHRGGSESTLAGGKGGSSSAHLARAGTTLTSGGVGGLGGMTSTLDHEALRRILRYCGNRYLDQNEQCDDGNREPADGCSRFCQIERGYTCPELGEPCIASFVCGNAKLEPVEQCDDANLFDGDGCSRLCRVEAGWDCPIPGHLCVPKCGDSLLVGKEPCDRGPLNGVDSGLGVPACSKACVVVEACRLVGSKENCLHFCGDGIVDFDEDCDEGEANGTSGYGGCDRSCRREPYCGDGFVSGGEQCDHGHSPDPEYGVAGGCDSNCRSSAYCGDGLIDSAYGEECETASPIAGLCTEDCGPAVLQY